MTRQNWWWFWVELQGWQKQFILPHIISIADINYMKIIICKGKLTPVNEPIEYSGVNLALDEFLFIYFSYVENKKGIKILQDKERKSG